MTDTSPTREELLEQYGRWYGQERFAIAFTETNAGDNSKRVVTTGWETTRPLKDAEYAAGLISQRGQKRNIAIVLRPSNLVVLECDTEEDLLAIQQWALPPTITVRSSEPYKRHFYFRPAPELERLPYVAFRFESGRLTADTGRYFLAPPSIHPSGAIYSFLPDHAPDDVDVAELPEDIYRDLAEAARESEQQTREHLHVDPDAKVPPGNRRESIFRFACLMRRWTANRAEILEAAQRWNDLHCDPPVTPDQVAMQVDGAMKMPGGDDLARAINEPVDPGPEWAEYETPVEDEDIDSWAPINLATLKDRERIKPTLGSAGIAYPEKRHVFSGPQESAKTLAAYVIALELIRDNQPVVVIDFEMGQWDTRDRLQELGATPNDLSQLAYVEPSEPATPERIARLVELRPAVVIIDAAAGAYDNQGLDDNKRQDVERFTRLYVRDFWRAGIATIVLDHVVKNTETRGNYAIGSERKVGGADVHLGFEVITPIKRGTTGIYKITTHKDRGGWLQRGRLADLHLVSDPDTHHITWDFKAAEHTDPTEPFRPTVLMEHVSRYLQKQDEPVTFTTVKGDVKGEDKFIAVALERLIEEGYATEEPGPRNARLVTHQALFTGQNPPLRTPAEPLRAGDIPTPARASISAGVAGDKQTTEADAGLNVFDPAVQALLDDDLPF